MDELGGDWDPALCLLGWGSTQSSCGFAVCCNSGVTSPHFSAQGVLTGLVWHSDTEIGICNPYLHAGTRIPHRCPGVLREVRRARPLGSFTPSCLDPSVNQSLWVWGAFSSALLSPSRLGWPWSSIAPRNQMLPLLFTPLSHCWGL